MDRDSHTRRGKWSEAGVPKKGWTCVGVEDLEEPSQLCEMCDSAKIRYAHIMEHPDYPGSLQVGCVCAELMEEDYKRPREREKRQKFRTPPRCMAFSKMAHIQTRQPLHQHGRVQSYGVSGRRGMDSACPEKGIGSRSDW